MNSVLRQIGVHRSYCAAAAFFCWAHRRLTASMMRFRPSGETFRFFFVVVGLFGLGATAFRVARIASPLKRARACCNLAISRSICDTIFETSMLPPTRNPDSFDSAARKSKTPSSVTSNLICAISNNTLPVNAGSTPHGYFPRPVRIRIAWKNARKNRFPQTPQRTGNRKVAKRGRSLNRARDFLKYWLPQPGQIIRSPSIFQFQCTARLIFGFVFIGFGLCQ
jgi:hypothetical protein